MHGVRHTHLFERGVSPPDGGLADGEAEDAALQDAAEADAGGDAEAPDRGEAV